MVKTEKLRGPSPREVAKNLGGSLDALGVTVFPEKGELVSPTEVSGESARALAVTTPVFS